MQPVVLDEAPSTALKKSKRSAWGWGVLIVYHHTAGVDPNQAKGVHLTFQPVAL